MRAFILAGQSNMEGAGSIADLSRSQRTLPSNVRLFQNSTRIDVGDFEWFGPEVGFAHAIAEQIPHEQIMLIKCAAGGTSLYAWSPDWSPQLASITENEEWGSLYAQLMGSVDTVIGDRSVEFAGVLWMQGERDAKYPDAAQEYGRNLKHFVERLREDLDAPHLPFILAQIDWLPAGFDSCELVRKAQADAPNHIPNTVVISTEGLRKWEDHVHYSSQGQLELGRRFAEGYLSRVQVHSR